ncbi:MAG: 2-C-methyl-D-erythritol 4-phosphate cytidylyltransferase [Prevotella sp.]|nr:2-C-methyl-D-erythritol 4-phosphate cytidylyltransferase [Prevotella sp.]
MNIAILLAGGSGSRLGGGKPKQFIEVCGKPILEYTLDAFESCPLIDEVCIVSRSDCIPLVEQLVAKRGEGKVGAILSGGKERYHSSLAALERYTCDEDNLLFHDAVRPMVTHRIIADCLKALDTFEAVGVAVPTTDTILEVDDRSCIVSVPPRRMLRNAQTPQGFKRRVIRRAYDLALRDPSFTTTDDCGVVLRYLPEVPIHVVEGEKTNIKVTYAEDLLLLEQLVSRQ